MKDVNSFVKVNKAPQSDIKAKSFSVKDLSKTMKVNVKLKFSLLKLVCFTTFR